MRITARLRTILMCAMLEYAALMGAPMRPDEIEELLRTMNKPKIAHVVTDKMGDGEK
jgi:hypothetical protein